MYYRLTSSSPRWPGMSRFSCSVRIRAYSAPIALYAALLLGTGPHMPIMIVWLSGTSNFIHYCPLIQHTSHNTQHHRTVTFTHEHGKRSILSISPHMRALQDDIYRKLMLSTSILRPASMIAGEYCVELC